ncbi:MAG: LamG domain-containing protein, partial [Deltaproteobacteria bacterium]|nr:LamG domain-containing protein [Deltaproteobacteria bacterium]
DPATDWVPGKIDGALDFDGGNDHVLVPHDPSLSLMNQFTVAAWIYANSGGLDAYDLVLNKGTSGNNQNYWFGTVGDEITFGFYNGGFREFNTSDENLQTDTWYHIAATFNNANNSVRVYLNGTEVRNWSTDRQPLTNSDDLYIGRSQYGEYWDGKLDDVRIYNRVLSEDEISVLYDLGN